MLGPHSSIVVRGHSPLAIFRFKIVSLKDHLFVLRPDSLCLDRHRLHDIVIHSRSVLRAALKLSLVVPLTLNVSRTHVGWHDMRAKPLRLNVNVGWLLCDFRRCRINVSTHDLF